LIKHLNTILEGQHVNYANFKKKYLKNKIKESDVRLALSVTPCACGKRDKYFINIKDVYIFNGLFAKFLTTNPNQKVEAALHGDSKTKKNPDSILIYKSDFKDNNGISIGFKDRQYENVGRKKDHLIILENLSNFNNIQLSFVDEDINLCDFNFVFASGNAITNNHFSDFFNEYESITCFFDIDLGGFKFYKTLKKIYDGNISFYYSKRMEKLLQIYGKPIQDDQHNKIIKYYKDVKGLETVLNSVFINNKFAEQEIFQHNYIDKG
jgi:hypothetical protein